MGIGSVIGDAIAQGDEAATVVDDSTRVGNTVDMSSGADDTFTVDEDQWTGLPDTINKKTLAGSTGGGAAASGGGFLAGIGSSTLVMVVVVLLGLMYVAGGDGMVDNPLAGQG